MTSSPRLATPPGPTRRAAPSPVPIAIPGQTQSPLRGPHRKPSVGHLSRIRWPSLAHRMRNDSKRKDICLFPSSRRMPSAAPPEAMENPSDREGLGGEGSHRLVLVEVMVHELELPCHVICPGIETVHVHRIADVEGVEYGVESAHGLFAAEAAHPGSLQLLLLRGNGGYGFRGCQAPTPTPEGAHCEVCPPREVRTCVARRRSEEAMGRGTGGTKERTVV